MKNLILLFLVSVVMSGCNKNKNDENCIEYRTAYVTNVDAPSIGIVNTDISIELLFGVINGCGSFSQFVETDNGNNRTIEIQAKYEGCICTQALETISVIYIFNAQTSGDYELVFKSSDTNFITVNIAIE
jgi:uncharacterized protein YceK